ncbi:MAG: hypothetical protein P8Z73_08860 [Desulfobacteraceae bacterium]|jgi:hypothetical protein
MKKCILIFSMALMMALAACTPRIYGVPEDRWETMSEQERVAAMEAYKARQETLRQQREERARLRAMEKEAQLAREAEEASQRQMHVDAIYRGEGLYGELLRVSLKDGQLQFHGVHKPFHPVSFRIAAGEMKDVQIVNMQGRKASMAVFYDGSNLLLDEKPNSRRSMAVRLPYEDAWQTGATYPDLVAKGPLEMRGVDVTVRIIGQPPRDRNHRRHRHPGAAQPSVRMPQRPAVVVVKEPGHRRGSQVVVIDQAPQTRNPDVIAVKPQPVEDRPGKMVPRRPHINDATAAAPPARIKVVFRNGRFTMKKRSYPLVPQTIVLKDGQVRDVVVRGQKGNLKIRVSYSAGEFLIDDIPNRHRRPTRLEFTPGWKNGQQYAVATCGNGLLKDLDIMIMSQ